MRTSLACTIPSMPSLIVWRYCSSDSTNSFGSNGPVARRVAAGDPELGVRLQHVVLLLERLLGELPVHGEPGGVPPLGAHRLDLPGVEDRGDRLEALPQRRGVLVEVDPRAAAPRLAPHRHEVEVVGPQVVLREAAPAGDRGVRAVRRVAPPVERAGEAALARARAPARPARRGGGRRSGRRPRRRRCARRRSTGRGSRTRRSRWRSGSPRAGRPSATRGARAARPRAGRSRGRSSAPWGSGRGPRSRRARGAPSTSDPPSPLIRLVPLGARRRRTILTTRYNGVLIRPRTGRRAGDRSRRHRDLPAPPRSRGRVLGGDARGGRRRGRHLVLEPLPGRPVRLRELHLRLPLLARSSSTSGSGREHFAEQPETERYLNHVVDRFDLRRHIRFGARVTLGDLRRAVRHVVGDDRRRRPPIDARFLVAATGVLSVPYVPDLPGRDDFRGVQHHTGRWPAEPVDFAGKRVAVVGTSSSGVQVVPAIVDEVASLTVYQRSANWCTPLNNRAHHRRRAGAAARRLRAAARGAQHLDPRVPPPDERAQRLRRHRPRSGWPSSRRCGRAPGS